MKKDLPGHIKKAFKSIDRFLPVIDMVVELVDARMPQGSRLQGLIDRLGKKSLIALGKADLADPDETRKWIERYRSEGVACVALDSRNSVSVKKAAGLIQKLAATSQSSNLARKARRVMILGIPNVGKSTLINSLAGRKAAKAANMPGVTRDVQWIKLAGQLELLDLPGILDFSLLKRGGILKLINTMPGNEDDCYDQARLLCEVLTTTGNACIIPGLADSAGKFDQFIVDYARRMNFLVRGGEVDEHRAAADMIRRFQSGGFGVVTIERADEETPVYAQKHDDQQSSEETDFDE
ncbi:MAG: YlqF/YawG family GTPase [Candidatus Rifleibacteriota bacterium]